VTTEIAATAITIPIVRIIIQWNESEQRAWHRYWEQQHRTAIEWQRAKEEQRRAYWRWRHDHPDRDDRR